MKSNNLPKRHSRTSVTPDEAISKSLPLSVEREKAKRLEERSRITEQKSATTRRNLDKRTARLQYSRDFSAEIVKYRDEFPHLKTTTRNGESKEKSQDDQSQKNGIAVFVRKRPIFDYEISRGDFDVVSIDTTSKPNGDDSVLVHNCLMHPDMKQMLMKPISFPCMSAFDEFCSNDDIYHSIAQPMVDLAARGGVATILMFGQTGSGKTHTMTAIEKKASEGLFQAAASHVVDIQCNSGMECGDDRPTISVQFVELAGKNCKDLLGGGGGGGAVKLSDNDDGSVHLVNATTLAATSPKQLKRIIAHGKSRRSTEATDKNGVSSRSHAVCQIDISYPFKKRRGLLTLIDCAGSERRHDALYHTKERQKESAEINSSLWALKECIRARASNNSVVSENMTTKKAPHIPYRLSNLTRILRESFEQEGARLCVIATIAPNATDTDHTVETLKTVSTVVGLEDEIVEGKKRVVSPASEAQRKGDITLPKLWNHEQLKAFMKRKKISNAKVPPNIDGKAVMRMSVPQIRNKIFGGESNEKANNLFSALRKENERIERIQRKERLQIAKERKGN